MKGFTLEMLQRWNEFDALSLPRIHFLCYVSYILIICINGAHRYNTGHAVSMINADQYQSMTDQISGIDPKYSSININIDQYQSILLNASQCRSMLLNGGQCLLELHWLPLYFSLI